MAVDLRRFCSTCGGELRPCLKCAKGLHCVEVYQVGGEGPFCFECADAQGVAIFDKPVRLYA